MIFNYFINKESTIIDYLNSFYISKIKIYKLFNDKNILLNNHECNRNDKIKKGDIISIIQDEKIDYKPFNKKINVLFEDDYLLIINKEPNIAIHEGKNINTALANMVANYYLENNINLNIRFAHRLDIETSGIIIFAKDLLTFSYLNHIIENHTLERYYRLLINGKLKQKEGKIDLPISENRHNNLMIVNKKGKSAITNYKLIKEYDKYSYLECKLETGRKHQIRCHFSEIGHPLIGDINYNDKSKLANRVMLHSYKIKFKHPVYDEDLIIEAPIPSDMEKLL